MRVGAVVAVAALVGIGTWLLVRGGDNPKPAAVELPRNGAVRAPLALLTALASASSTPIYWAGPHAGDRYELTKSADGRVFIRYLPLGAPIGSEQPYLTVGSYPVPNAFSVTSRLAGRSGMVRVATGGGGVAFYDERKPTNVFLAYPRSRVQVEVFSPVAHEAQLLVGSGGVVRVPKAGETARPTAAAVPAAALPGIAALARHPVYWAGPRARTTYELTRSSDGRLFIRYLPPGVAVGSTQPFLTVGSYPIANAYGVTLAQSKTAGAVALKLARGGIAFYRSRRPTNVFVAYPRTNVQVEVYDPAPGRARSLVTAGAVTPVG
ncbi:MAG TPA: hypothetical protein VLK36_03610 [Gaiellaceae bacterium]|nr:hypothetical protein [Gaiellaceae bacterium]